MSGIIILYDLFFLYVVPNVLYEYICLYRLHSNLFIVNKTVKKNICSAFFNCKTVIMYEQGEIEGVVLGEIKRNLHCLDLYPVECNSLT